MQSTTPMSVGIGTVRHRTAGRGVGDTISEPVPPRLPRRERVGGRGGNLKAARAGQGRLTGTTAEDGSMDVADMTGKTVVITGGNSGIGLETAVALAKAGAKTVITARDRARGEVALADIRARSDRKSVV